MKKIFLGIAACTLMLASCTQNEVVENINEGKGALRFSAISGNISTRAAETVIKDLQDNGVDLFALIKPSDESTYSEYFTDKLAYDIATTSWAPGTKRYLKEGFVNQFYSIYPAQTGINAETLATAGVGFDYAVKAGASEDLLGAAATEEYKPSGDGNGVAVKMPFYHLLAQANFGVTGVKGLGHVEITEISFNQVGASGTYKFGTEGVGNNNWTNPTRADFPMTSAEIKTKTVLPAPGDDIYLLDRTAHSLMLVPAAFSTSTITFKFRVYDLADTEVTDGETIGTISLDATAQANPDAAWKQGLRYVYLIDFSEWFANRLLKFTVELDDWENYDWGTVEGAGSGVVEIQP